MTTTRQVSVHAPDGGSFDAQVTIPDGGRGPGILLLQEIFGVNDFMATKAESLAALGFVVLCPDVFWRVQPNLALPHHDEALEEAFGVAGRYREEVPDELKVGDLVAALEHLQGLPEVRVRTGVVGYCLGGFLAYRVAAAGRPDACVAYYGSGIEAFLDEAEAIACPILFHYGDADPYIPMSAIEQVAASFAARPNARIEIQPGAGHAFENLLAPRFANPEAAARSWPVTVAFLHEHLDWTPPEG